VFPSKRQARRGMEGEECNWIFNEKVHKPPWRRPDTPSASPNWNRDAELSNGTKAETRCTG